MTFIQNTQDELFNRIAAIAASDTGPAQEPVPLVPAPLFPDPHSITLVTFNRYDNGAAVRQTWQSSRHVMNTQVFDLRTPFTPNRTLAATTFAVQLHDPEFFIRYVEGKKTDIEVAGYWPHYVKLYETTLDLTREGAAPLLGQVWMKRSGWTYLWGHTMRTWTDGFGVDHVELGMPGRTIKVEGFEPAKVKPGDPLVSRSRFDPHGLWKPKANGFKRKAP